MIRSYIRRLLPWIPLVASSALFIYWIYYRLTMYPPGGDNMADVKNMEMYQLTIEQVTNANEFLISIVTLLFGVCGYFLESHKKHLQVTPLTISYFACLILLALSYLSAFHVHANLIKLLSYEQAAFDPEGSVTFFYLEEEFKLCFGTSFILLTLLLTIFVTSTKSK